ncbi:MAG TPA: hypothetical protein VGF81_01685 [Solirubrobacteraceae bacterium]|jgi:hypothetical protein
MTRSALAVLAAAVALTACGGSSSTSSTATHTATTSSGGSASQVTTGPVRGKLVGDNHSPKLKANWFYTVTVTDASGKPLNGTVLTEFAVGGQVEGHETPPTHRLVTGRLHDRINFPPESLGVPLALQTVVHTPKGSITLSWPVTPTK